MFNGQMTLLMLAASPGRDSDLVETVTNLQQLFAGFGPVKHELDLGAKRPARGESR
jgi:hypothetical protein